MARESVLHSASALDSHEKTIHGLPSWYVGALQFLLVGVFGLIGLGGATRIMNAGLACPDWPLCFGDFIPDYHPQVYFEFIHRVVAGVVATVTVTLQIILWRSRAPGRLKALGVFIVALLLTQVIFGGLTVLLQLHSKVVAAHLGLGTGFFALLLWMYLSLRDGPREVGIPKWMRGLAGFLAILVYGQILLGGMVASHFASLVCTDFPTCHGQWFPTFRGIIGLHVIHRLGAYSVFTFVLLATILVVNYSASVRQRRIMMGVLALVCLQIAIGIANVIFLTPPVIAVAHLATATAILGLGVAQFHLVSQSSQRT
jgi:cytochrome c oxidase assembly protein subunit 15